MITDQKAINYRGKMVFQKLTMSSDFTRIPKYFTEDEACFLFLSKGSFHFRTPTNQVTFQQGEGLLAKCGNYFIEQNDSTQASNDGTLSLIGAYFYPEIVKEFFQTDLTVGQFQTDFDATKVNIEPLFNLFLESLTFLFNNPAVADEHIIVNKLKELLILLSKSEKSASIASFVSSLFDPHEYDFDRIIQQNIYADLNLAELSHLCNCSVSSFKRRFAEYYHTSPAKYFLTKKLERAAQLLLVKNKPIADIAYACGFENVTSFNKIFKKQFSKTPTEYRLNQTDK